MLISKAEKIGTMTRNVGVDLAKVLAVFFVLIHHISDAGLSIGLGNHALICVHSFVHNIVYSCIDLFALSTGYLCVTSRCRYSRLLNLWCATVFWGVVVLLFCAVVLGHSIPLRRYLGACLPILRDQYWFFTAYFILFLFMPLLNTALVRMSKCEFRWLLVAILIFVSFYSCVGAESARLSGGYSFSWLAMVYIFGAYIRRFCNKKVSSFKCFLIALALGLIPTTVSVFRLRSWSNILSLSTYLSPFTLGVAIFIFVGCINLTICKHNVSVVLKMLASASFGVYLIHSQPYFFTNVFQSGLRKVQVDNIPSYLIAVVAFSLLSFMISAFLELLRIKLFEKMKVAKVLERADAFLPPAHA